MLSWGISSTLVSLIQFLNSHTYCPSIRSIMHPLLCVVFLYAVLCSSTQVPLGLGLDMTAGLPTLTLPYAKYRASSFNPNRDVSYRAFSRFDYYTYQFLRSTPSKTFALRPPQLVISAGRSQRHHSKNRRYRMAHMVQYAGRRPLKDRN